MTFSLPKAINAAYFDKSCEIEGNQGWAASRWESADDQLIRFKTIENLFDFRNASVLDVGCGQGDLFYYLDWQKYNINYQGIDASPKMIEYAHSKPAPNKFFVESDLLGFETDKKYDYVIANGLFSIPVGAGLMDQYQYIRENIKKMFSLANAGVFVNFLSAEVGKEARHEEFFYYDPPKILSIINDHTWKVKYDHTIYDHEFMIAAYQVV